MQKYSLFLIAGLHLQVIAMSAEKKGVMEQAMTGPSVRLQREYSAEMKADSEPVDYSGVLVLADGNKEAKTEGGFNALHVAVANKSESEIHQLLSHVNLEEKTDQGLTALHLAVASRELAIVKILLDAGACPCPGTETEVVSPLVCAIMFRQEHISRLLVDAEMKLKRGSHSGMTMLFSRVSMGDKSFVEAYLAAKLSFDDVDLQEQTVLHRAAKRGHTEIAQILVDAGAKLNEVDSNGETALMLAAWRKHRDLAWMLIEAKADLNIFSDGGLTVLHIAILEGLEAVVSLLLSKGVDPNLRTKKNRSPLELAFDKKNGKMILLLIHANANILEVDEERNSLLHMLAKTDFYEPDLLHLAVSRNIYLNYFNRSFVMPLSYAVFQGNIKTVEWLLAAGADIQAYSMLGLPLHCAAIRGDPAVIKLLIKSGAKVNKLVPLGRESKYQSALSSAVQYGKLESLKCLLEAGAVLRYSFIPQRLGFSEKSMMDIELSLQELLTTTKHEKGWCDCLGVMKILMQKGVSLSPIKLALLAHIKGKKQRPSVLDSVIMFQLIGPSFFKT